ncbi:MULTISPECIES: hypothetical protein [unclassified Streptomyces]|uniref:hypothetical protein n=1 Tax=Streptomyces sp. SYP-A7185 TaxID=3040076 RepID=UPI0038F7071C
MVRPAVNPAGPAVPTEGREAAGPIGPPDAPAWGGSPAPETSEAAGSAARCTSRNGATGICRADGNGDDGVQGAALPARSSPVTGRAVSLSGPDGAEVEAAETRLLDAASSRTPGRDDPAVNEGFCHVDSRLPNAESATPDPPPRTASWIGASPDQAPGTAAPLPDAVAAGASEAVSGVAEPPRSAPSNASTPLVPPPFRARSRSKNPTPQPSAPASVTNDAIWSV